MQGSVSRFKLWIRDLFETRKDIFAAASTLLFILAAVIKISVFNQILIPNADKWMFRYKFLLTGLIILITYPVLFRFKKRAVFITFYIVQVIFIVVNMSFYMYFKTYVHIDQLISNFYEGAIAVLNSSSPKSPLLLTALMDLPFFICLCAVYPRAHRLRMKLRIPVTVVVAISLLVTAYTQYGHYKDDNFITQIANSQRIGESYIIQRYGSLTNIVVSMVKMSNEKELIDSFQYGPELVKGEGSENNPDIFIIQVEAMESEIINKKYKDSYVMPFLNSLTRESVYYPYMVSYHFYGGTSDCEFSVINTVEPLTYYTSIKLMSYDFPNSFVKRLVDGSYKAYGFHGNIGRYYNRDVAFNRFGFNDYYDIDRMGMKDVGWGAPDSDVLGFSLNRVSESEGPVLSYVITMSSHGPFTNVSNYYNNDAYNDIEDKKLQGYYNSMSYVDQNIEEYVKEIRKQYDNAYIIIFGDHTPQVENSSYKEANIMIDDYRYEFVPLFIITPDGISYREDKQAASFIDVAPTVLNISGVKYDIRTYGKDLLDFGGEAATIPYRGLQWDREELFQRITSAMEVK